jgi:hypothetical protein
VIGMGTSEPESADLCVTRVSKQIGTKFATACVPARNPLLAAESSLNRLFLIAGVHMTDKHRHRRVRAHAPHGHLPNWLLFVFFACAVGVASLARVIV